MNYLTKEVPRSRPSQVFPYPWYPTVVQQGQAHIRLPLLTLLFEQLNIWWRLGVSLTPLISRFFSHLHHSQTYRSEPTEGLTANKEGYAPLRPCSVVVSTPDFRSGDWGSTPHKANINSGYRRRWSDKIAGGWSPQPRFERRKID